jgi:intracellular septation protein
MKLLFDLFPVILFFAAYVLGKQFGDPAEAIYLATGVAIVAGIIQVAWLKLRHGQVQTMHWVTLGLLVVFGGMTLLLHDPTFIKWKPSVVNWLFAAAFLGSGWFMERNLLQRSMEHAVQLPGPVWRRLNMAWVLFFVFMGLANLYVAYNFSEETWVNFKLFGMLGLTVLFLLGQGWYLARHVQTPEQAAATPEERTEE